MTPWWTPEKDYEMNQLSINHIHTSTMTTFLIRFVTPWSRPRSQPWRLQHAQSAELYRPHTPESRSNDFTIQTETRFTERASTSLYCENPAVWRWANIFSLLIMNQHIGIKIGSVKQYGLQLQNRQFDGEMKPKQHWLRNPERAESRSRWAKLGFRSAPSGIPCSCEQNVAVSLCLLTGTQTKSSPVLKKRLACWWDHVASGTSETIKYSPERPVWVIDPRVWRLFR